MALRQGVRSLARSVLQAKSLPQRGGGGGPIQYAPAPAKPVGHLATTFNAAPQLSDHYLLRALSTSCQWSLPFTVLPNV